MLQQPLDFPRAALVGAVSALGVLTLSGICSSWLLLHGTQRSGAPVAWRSQDVATSPREVLGVLQTPIRDTDEAEQRRNADVQRLSTYGWVDRSRELVHIPIDTAIDLMVGDLR